MHHPHPNPLPEGEGFLAPTTLTAIAGNLIHGTSEGKLVEKAQTQFKTENPTEQQIQQAFEPQADELVKPFHNPDLRELIETLRRDSEQIIDESADELLDEKLGYSQEKAESCIKSWEQFIKDHQDELDAIQLIYNQPYQQRHLSYEQIEKLAEEIEQPPYNLAPIAVWKAYEQLEKAKVKGAPPEKLLTNIISLIRYSTGLSNVLEPFNELVNKRFENWMKQQNQIKPATKPPLPQGEGWGEGEKSPLPLGEDLGEGRFSPEQLQWLNKIKDQIAQNAEMTVEDFEYTPFNQDGGLLKAKELFGNDLDGIIQELNGYLIA